MWQTVSDLSRKKPGMERSGLTLTAFLQAGWPDGSNIGGAPTNAAQRLCCCDAAGQTGGFVSAYLYVVQNVLRLNDSLLPRPLAGWPVEGGERGTGAAALAATTQVRYWRAA